MKRIKSLVFVPGSKYARFTSRMREDLEKSLAHSYDVGGACIFPSGMAAITFLFQVFAEKGRSTVFLSNEVYCDTPRSLKMFYDLKVVRFDASDPVAFKRLFEKHQPSLVFFETFSNPSGIRFDRKILKITRDLAPDCAVAIDNTFASSVLFNPFEKHNEVKPTFVVESLTKYVSGGTRIAGAIVGSKKSIKPFKDIVRLYGLHIPDDHLSVIYEQHKTIRQRVTAASELAYVIHRLMTNLGFDVVTPLHKPALPIIVFRIKTCMKKQEIIKIDYGLPWETSYGSPYSKICNWFKVNETEVEFRLSVGYDSDVDDVISALENLRANLIH